MDSGPNVLPRLILHDDIIFRPMTHSLADFTYVFVFSDWAQLFDKLKRVLTCALLPWWMYFFWIQLFTFYCFYVVESWSSMFDKLLCGVTSLDLSSTFQLDMEWLMLYRPLFT